MPWFPTSQSKMIHIISQHPGTEDWRVWKRSLPAWVLREPSDLRGVQSYLAWQASTGQEENSAGNPKLRTDRVAAVLSAGCQAMLERTSKHGRTAGETMGNLSNTYQSPIKDLQKKTSSRSSKKSSTKSYDIIQIDSSSPGCSQRSCISISCCQKLILATEIDHWGMLRYYVAYPCIPHKQDVWTVYYLNIVQYLNHISIIIYS